MKIPSLDLDCEDSWNVYLLNLSNSKTLFSLNQENVQMVALTIALFT